MSKYYYETLDIPTKPTPSFASNITRHLHARKHLGTSMVIANNPFGLMSVIRKQWLRLTRAAQNQRASTLNADRILRLTYTITHMQRINFVAKTPVEMPNAHIFFVTPDQISQAPRNCFSVYVAADVDETDLAKLIEQMPASGLIVDYTHKLDDEKLGLHPKYELENKMDVEWQHAIAYLEESKIDIHDLVHNTVQYMGAVDDALDILLNDGRTFLQIASNFQHASMLAQPVRTTNVIAEQYEMMGLLAHRVQALSPGTFTLPIDDAFHEEQATFFLHDYIPDEEYDQLIKTVDDSPTPHAHKLINQTQTS
ncbi:MAG TPA: hypothetical protein VNX65_02815 [Patescibacteria group bacterium]|jgi:hypothetical protein|nr:hypothetical protein [Patescibacteria group bacterium]